MAVTSSGQITINNLVAEFGGSAPHSLSEYYGGGSLVPAGANPNVPTSGEIEIGDFYGAVAATVLNITGNVNNYNIKSAVVAAGGDQNTPVILTISSGVTVGSTSSSTPAMKTDTGWGSGVTINITNNGSIVGGSGSGGNVNPGSGGGAGGRGQAGYGGHSSTSGSAGSAGSGSATSAQNGGVAFEHSQSGNNLQVTFDTAGTRTGGSGGTATLIGNGGGGGGSGTMQWWIGGYGPGRMGSGGGGGANNGAGGGNGNYNNANPGGAAGSAGGTTTGGAYGAAHAAYYHNNAANHHIYITGSHGGQGGNLGQAGGSGTRSGSYGGGSVTGTNRSGGAAGSNGSASGSAGAALSGNTGKIN